MRGTIRPPTIIITVPPSTGATPVAAAALFETFGTATAQCLPLGIRMLLRRLNEEAEVTGPGSGTQNVARIA
jgi:hypothetical protein